MQNFFLKYNKYSQKNNKIQKGGAINCCICSDDIVDNFFHCMILNPKFDEKKNSKYIQNHAVCSSCLTEFFKSQIGALDEKVYNVYKNYNVIQCPCDYKCDGFISKEILNERLNENENKIYKSFLNMFENNDSQLEVSDNISSGDDVCDNIMREIINVLTFAISCPYCHNPFYEFEGCMAVTCNNPKCKKQFCSICLKKHKNSLDAHENVRECSRKMLGENLRYYEMVSDLFTSENGWKKTRTRFQIKELIKYFRRIGEHDTRKCLEKIIKDIIQPQINQEINEIWMNKLIKIINKKSFFEEMTLDLFKDLVTEFELIALIDIDIVEDDTNVFKEIVNYFAKVLKQDTKRTEIQAENQIHQLHNQREQLQNELLERYPEYRQPLRILRAQIGEQEYIELRRRDFDNLIGMRNIMQNRQGRRIRRNQQAAPAAQAVPDAQAAQAAPAAHDVQAAHAVQQPVQRKSKALERQERRAIEREMEKEERMRAETENIPSSSDIKLDPLGFLRSILRENSYSYNIISQHKKSIDNSIDGYGEWGFNLYTFLPYNKNVAYIEPTNEYVTDIIRVWYNTPLINAPIRRNYVIDNIPANEILNVIQSFISKNEDKILKNIPNFKLTNIYRGFIDFDPNYTIIFIIIPSNDNGRRKYNYYIISLSTS
jgi:hypothetical protein